MYAAVVEIPSHEEARLGGGCAEPLPIEKYGDMWCVIEHSNSRFESIRFVMRIDSNRLVL